VLFSGLHAVSLCSQRHVFEVSGSSAKDVAKQLKVNIVYIHIIWFFFCLIACSLFIGVTRS
jgi:hypothetical protein